MRAARKRAIRAFLLLVLASIYIFSCDRGYSFYPVDWERCDVVRRSVTSRGWCYENEDLRIELTPPGGLVLSTYLTPEPWIANLTGGVVTLLAPILASEGVEYKGTFDGKVSVWLLEAGAREEVGLWFALDEPLRDALGRSARLSMPYRVDEGTIKEIRVVLERKSP